MQIENQLCPHKVGVAQIEEEFCRKAKAFRTSAGKAEDFLGKAEG